MNNKFINTYNYTIGFLYLLYFVFLGNYIHNLLAQKTIHDLWAMFSLTGVYFSIFVFLFYSLRKLSLLLFAKHSKVTSFIVKITKNVSPWVLLFLCLGNLLSKMYIIFPIADSISSLIPFNQVFIIFIMGFILFLGSLSIFKYSNHKVMGVSLVLLFINGLYLGIMWHSFNEQKSLYQNLYVAAVKNDVTLANCNNGEISCVKLPKNQNILDLLSPQSVNSTNRSDVADFMSGFRNEISNIKNGLATYSYGESVYKSNVSYRPIAVYDEKNNYLIIDYLTLNTLQKEAETVFYNIVGVGSFFWLLLLLTLLGTHEWINFRFIKSKKVSN